MSIVAGSTRATGGMRKTSFLIINEQCTAANLARPQGREFVGRIPGPCEELRGRWCARHGRKRCSADDLLLS